MDLQKIKDKLQNQLAPTFLDLIDDTRQHANHPEAQRGGGGHFRLIIVSDQFKGLKSLERHRLIYEILKEEMKQKIHALAIQAFTSDEYKKL